MLRVKDKQSEKEFLVEFLNSEKTSGTLDSRQFQLDVIHETEQRFHVIIDQKSYQIEVVYIDANSKNITLKVGNHVFEMNIKDKYDILLKQLGIDSDVSKKIKELKAPMPGLVLDIVVAEGAEIKQGEPLLILEAMKMENSIKSPVDGIIKKIHVSKSVAVEKNQLLISFQ